jgi:hypothetical protein
MIHLLGPYPSNDLSLLTAYGKEGKPLCISNMVSNILLWSLWSCLIDRSSCRVLIAIVLQPLQPTLIPNKKKPLGKNLFFAYATRVSQYFSILGIYYLYCLLLHLLNRNHLIVSLFSFSSLASLSN